MTLAYDTLLKPTLSVYRDINEYGGTYFNLSIAHSFPVYKEITLDLGASAGYFAGSDNYWKTYQSSTAAYTGKKYSAFHDGGLYHTDSKECFSSAAYAILVPAVKRC